MNYKTEVERWIKHPVVNSEDKKALIDTLPEFKLEEYFYKELSFGTGGLRGVMQLGTNCINEYTIAKASQGLANYLREIADEPSIAIAYDSRNNSKFFAEVAASVFEAAKITCYVFDSLRPTPMLSFAVRELKASAGIVVTASHNPKEYNGYKVYGRNGGQITDGVAKAIQEHIAKVDIFEDVKRATIGEQESCYVKTMPGSIDETYYKNVSNLSMRKDFLERNAHSLNILYTPIHGSGNIPVREALLRLGFTNVQVVKEQELPDGNFPTAPYPNPEEPSVFEPALIVAKESNPDIIIGTDPDCDRVGVLTKDHIGEYRLLTGNQVGVLLADYLLNTRKELGLLTPKDTIVKTIVSTEMSNAICKEYGVELKEVLTGFKYIGELAEEFHQKGTNNFILGFEESYGYLTGDFVRDKDGVIATALICEMALYYKTKGLSLIAVLEKLYDKHGYYIEQLSSITLKGKDGQEQMERIIEELRTNPCITVGDSEVIEIEDYLTSRTLHLKAGMITSIRLPKSNVLKFKLNNQTSFVIRPSGTEPKMKIYLFVNGPSSEEAITKVTQLYTEVDRLINSIKESPHV